MQTPLYNAVPTMDKVLAVLCWMMWAAMEMRPHSCSAQQAGLFSITTADTMKMLVFYVQV